MAQVLVVPILAGASGKAHVKPLTYVSALMALAGVGLLVEKGGVIMPGAGDMWSLLSAVFFGIQVRCWCWQGMLVAAFGTLRITE